MTTKTAQFTPGPWTVSAGRVITTSSGQFYLTYGKDKYGNPLFKDFVELDNNAHLIAAAPAMYEALKALHSVLDQRMPDGRTLNQHLSREVFECFYGPAIAARVAIAKAEGA